MLCGLQSENMYMHNTRIMICKLITQFLLNLMGMKAASSQHSCIWCEVKDVDRSQQNVLLCTYIR